MLRTLTHTVERIAAPLPGWLFLLSGITLVALSLLVPAWADVREMDWQVKVMRLQAQSFEAKVDSYKEFNAALAVDDPVLLERLAYYHLRLKPVGAQAVLLNHTAPGSTTRQERIPTVEELLHRPVPTPGINMPAYKPLNTRLLRLTRSTPTRLAMLAAGLLCVTAGITAVTPRVTPIDDEYGNAPSGMSDETESVEGTDTSDSQADTEPISQIEEPLVAVLDEDAHDNTQETGNVVADGLGSSPAQSDVQPDDGGEVSPSWRHRVREMGDQLKTRLGSLPLVGRFRRGS